jgi:hypothetical protein
MFGYQGGESASTVARKKGYRQEAQQKWSCLTTIDLSQIKNEMQLATMVAGRYSLPLEQARKDVATWAEGKQF